MINLVPPSPLPLTQFLHVGLPVASQKIDQLDSLSRRRYRTPQVPCRLPVIFSLAHRPSLYASTLLQTPAQAATTAERVLFHLPLPSRLADTHFAERAEVLRL